MATANCPGEINYSKFVADQVSPIQDVIRQSALIDNPFTNLLPSYPIDINNVGPTLRTLKQGRVVPGNGYIDVPVFSADRSACGASVSPDKTGQIEFNAQLEVYQGESQMICVREARHAVKNSLIATTKALKDGISRITGNDIRATVMNNSGLKFVMSTASDPNLLLTGGENEVGTAWANTLPTSAPTFRALQWLTTRMREDFTVEAFGSGAGSYLAVILGKDTLDNIANEDNVKNASYAMTEGGYMEGITQLKSYAFVNYMHKGMVFGTDQQPLRFNEISDGTAVDPNGNTVPAGYPVFIPSRIEVAVDTGVTYANNPAWLTAKYEVGFVIGKNSFEYYVPKTYVGEGDWKFAPIASNNELMWWNERSDCNKRGDFGQFLYEIKRIINPVEPHAVCPFTYKRCTPNLGLVDCSGYGE